MPKMLTDQPDTNHTCEMEGCDHEAQRRQAATKPERRWYLDAWHDWAPLFNKSGYNWVDFTIVRLAVEHSPYKSSNEASIALLGFHLCFTRMNKREPA